MAKTNLRGSYNLRTVEGERSSYQIDDIDILNIGSIVIQFDTVADMIIGELPDGSLIELAEGQIVITNGYLSIGDSGNNTYEIVAAGTGVDDGGSFIDLSVLQAKALFNKDLIHARSFGLIDDVSIDQFSKLNSALSYGDANSRAFSFTGLNIRIGSQFNKDTNYTEISGTGSYAIKVSNFCSISSEDLSSSSIGNLIANDDQYVIFSEDCEYFEASKIKFVGNHTEQSFGGTLFLMGNKKTFLNENLHESDGKVIVGASPSKPTTLFTYTNLEFNNCWGSFCIGGKTGGIDFVMGLVLKFIDCRGGANWEAEDLNSFGHNAELHVITEGYIGKDIDGDKDAANPVEAFVVKCADTTFGVMQLGYIQAEDCTATLGNAGALKVSGGQSNKPTSHVHVAAIHAVRCLQAVLLTCTETLAGKVRVDFITGTLISQILKVRDASLTATPGAFQLVSIGVVDVNVTTTGINVINEDVTFTGNLIDHLYIENCKIESAINVSLAAEDVGVLEINSFQCDEVTTFNSGAFYGNAGFYVTNVDRFIVNDRVEIRNTHNNAVRVEVNDNAVINGLLVDNTAAASGFTVGGAGDIKLTNFSITNCAAFAFRNPTYTGIFEIYDGLVSDNVSGNFDGFRPNNSRNIKGYLEAKISPLTIPTLAAGDQHEEVVAVDNLRFGDIVTASPLADLGGRLEDLDINAYPTGNNLATIIIRNVSITSASPSAVDWQLIAVRDIVI